MHEKRLIHLFLTFIIYHVDSTFQLHIFNMMITEFEEFIESTKSVELNEFIELRKFRNSKKNM